MLLPSFLASDLCMMCSIVLVSFNVGDRWRTCVPLYFCMCTSILLYVAPTVPCALSIDGYMDLGLDGSVPVLGVKNMSIVSTKLVQAFSSALHIFLRTHCDFHKNLGFSPIFRGFALRGLSGSFPPCDMYPISIMMTYIRIGPILRLVSLCGISVCLIR